ncbi:MAG: trypsin-like serine protease, partial [Limisphaerales bacterium]
MAYFVRFGSMMPRIHHHLFRLLGLCLFFGLLCPLAKAEITKAFRPRIVGGEDAQRGEFPWLVSLPGPWSCGASLIGDEWILTAAHCVVDDLNQVMPAEDFELAIGALYLSEVTQTHPIEQIIVHPGYDPTTMENDIALLRLTQPYDLTHPRLALNQDPSIPQPGDLATVAGWGALTSEGASSDRMQKVSVPIVSLAQANDPKAYGGDILPSMLAAGFIQGGKDSCQGDSGGPLVVEVQGKSIQVGVVSWGKGCAEPYAYGIYTRVAAFIDWVEAITGLSGSAPTDRELIITRSPQSWSGNLGQTAHFSVLADGEPPLTYQWLFNGQELEGAQGASLVIPQVGLEHQGLYSVWVSAGNQQMLSQEASLDLLQRIDLGEALDQPQ